MAFSLKDYSGFEKIGEGGMGKVYVATQLSLDRRVVIKEISADLLKNPALVQRFENEAKSAASLDHDNIIRVYDFGEDRGFFYIAMEYIDGPDLEQLLSWEQFPKVIGLMVVLQALKGLNYAHRHGMAHGDVKPDNILVSKTGRVKITDFGLSYFNAKSDDFPAAGTVFLTPAYMPPEQANKFKGLDIDNELFSETIPTFLQPQMITPPEGLPNGIPFGRGTGEPDIRMDIWSVGVLLYRVLCGRFPFSGEDISRLAQSIGHESATPIQEIVPTLPENLEERINSCLIKEPRDRLSTLESLIEALENFFFDIGIRDIEKEIGKYLADRPAAVAELEKLLSGYHIRLSEEYLAGGNARKSDVHFEEAEKINASAGNARKNGSLRRPSSARNAKTQRVPLVSKTISKPGASSAKSKVFKTMVEAVAVLFIVSLGATGSFTVVRKILLIHRPSPSIVTAVTRPETMQPLPVQPPSSPPGSDTTVTENDRLALLTVMDPPSASVDGAQWPRDTAVKESAKKTQNTGPGTGRPVRKSAPQTGILKITITPLQAKVSIDDDDNISYEELIGGKSLKPGPHTITVLADGYESYQSEVKIEGNTTKTLSIALEPVGTNRCFLEINAYPGASIYIDGAPYGTAPRTLALAEGEHFLILHCDGYGTYSQTVLVTPDKTTRLQIRLEKQ